MQRDLEDRRDVLRIARIVFALHNHPDDPTHRCPVTWQLHVINMHCFSLEQYQPTIATAINGEHHLISKEMKVHKQSCKTVVMITGTF